MSPTSLVRCTACGRETSLPSGSTDIVRCQRCGTPIEIAAAETRELDLFDEEQPLGAERRRASRGPEWRWAGMLGLVLLVIGALTWLQSRPESTAPRAQPIASSEPASRAARSDGVTQQRPATGAPDVGSALQTEPPLPPGPPPELLPEPPAVGSAARNDLPRGWPPYEQLLTGSHEVQIRNPPGKHVRIGVRHGSAGKDFTLRPSDQLSLWGPRGRYELWVYYPDDDDLYRSRFEVKAQGVLVIDLVQSTSGNLPLDKVR